MFAHGAEWTIDESTSDLVLMGLGAADSTHAVAGTCAQTGAEPSFLEGGTWQKTHNSPSGVIMDTAATPGNEVSVYTTFGGPYVSTDQGGSWKRAANVVGLSQSVQVFNNGTSIGATGQLTLPGQGSFNGVLVSTDGKGEEWKMMNIEGAEYARYGAFPSSTTWYVTAGTWPATATEAPFLHAFEHLEEGFDLSARIRIGPKDMKNVKSPIGWMSKIWKTTDGGASWREVFSSHNAPYCFNAIACSTESRCVAVADGHSGSSASVYALMTEDGGKTWSMVFDSDKYESMMAVTFTSEMEGWIAPSGYASSDPRDGVVTDFMRTTDGGSTWNIDQSLKSCISTDMESAGSLTLSTCLMEGGLKSRIATYA